MGLNSKHCIYECIGTPTVGVRLSKSYFLEPSAHILPIQVTFYIRKKFSKLICKVIVLVGEMLRALDEGFSTT